MRGGTNDAYWVCAVAVCVCITWLFEALALLAWTGKIKQNPRW